MPVLQERLRRAAFFAPETIASTRIPSDNIFSSDTLMYRMGFYTPPPSTYRRRLPFHLQGRNASPSRSGTPWRLMRNFWSKPYKSERQSGILGPGADTAFAPL